MVHIIVKNYRQSPRKVRLVADLVRGKSVPKALLTLRFLTKKAAGPLEKAIEEAVADAKHNFNLKKDSLFIKEIRIDEGVTLLRRMPRARGSAYPIRKRRSHIRIVLDTEGNRKESRTSVVGHTPKKVSGGAPEEVPEEENRE